MEQRLLRAAIDETQTALRALADPSAAGHMAAYMKTDMPFYGVKSPGWRPIHRRLRDRLDIDNRGDYEQAVVALWELPHREEKYIAVALAAGLSRFHLPESMPLYERMIVEGAWWDFVDEIAARCVGGTLLHHRADVQPLLDDWIGAENMWLRRAALLGHLKHRADTDEETLFAHCLRLAPEKEFFIRKAIGWVLREYAKTNPGAVAAFVDAHRDVWSGLTYREATKHLGSQGSR